MTSTNPANLDVPALVPSAMGHRPQLSISSSSSGWSAVITDEEEGDPYVYAGSDYNSEMISLDLPSSKPSSNVNSGLSYTRRPSATNHRATVPLLHRGQPSSSLVSSFNSIPQSLPSPFYGEDDASSICYSEEFIDDSERESTPSLVASQRKRNRASLPAYFSLLQGSSSAGSASPSSSPRPPRRIPSALQSISRSLHVSPTTPRAPHTAVLPNKADGQELDLASSPRGRGRRRERDPDARSASSRRDIARSPPRHVSRQTLSAAHRARIDSVEKVAEWVSSSPVIAQQQQHRKYTVKLVADPHMHRRNSSPRPAKPKYEFAEALAMSLRGCAIADDEEVEEESPRGSEERRGRRRMDDDEQLRGLKARERERDRGRAGLVRALNLH